MAAISRFIKSLAAAREKLDKAQLSLNIQEEKLNKAEAIKRSFGKRRRRRKSKKKSRKRKTRKSKKKGI